MQVVGGGFAGGGETTPDNVADSTISITQRKPHAFDGSGGRKPPRQYGISTTTLKKPMAMQRHLTIASPLIRGTFAACTSLRSRCRADETEATVAIQTIDKVTTAIRESELAAPFVPTATASDAPPPTAGPLGSVSDSFGSDFQSKSKLPSFSLALAFASGWLVHCTSHRQAAVTSLRMPPKHTLRVRDL